MAEISGKLRGQVDKKIMAAKIALRVGVSEIARSAKNLCPVKTGKLRDSIAMTEKKNGELYIVSANAKNKHGLNYAKFVEFDPRINRPFLYPAFYQNVDTIVANVKRAIE